MKLRNLFLSAMALCSLGLFAQTHTQGIEYYKADQFNNAKELLNRNLNNPGTDKALSYYYLGQIEMRKGNVSAASKYFNDGIAADAENPYNYVGLGYIDLKNGDAKGAEKYFKEAESRAKKDQSVMVEIARAYYNADPVGNKAIYEKRIANALKKDSKNPDIYIFEGDVLRDDAYANNNSKSYGSAAAKYDMATSYDPTSAVAYVKYADMYMNAQNPGYAIIKLEELINNNPSSALGQRELANAYYENNQYDKAALQYGNYVKNPNHFKEDEDRYSFILFADGKYQQAYDYATSLLQQNPDNFTAMRYQFMNAAQIESLQGNILPLAEKLLAAHKANPDNKFAAIDYTLIAEELDRDKRPEDAIALLQEAISVMPSNSNFDKQLALLYIDSGDYDKAADEYAAFIAKTANPGYNEFTQQALYAYFAGLLNKEGITDKNTGEVLRQQDAAAARKYFGMAADYSNKAAQAAPNVYKPHKILGDLAIAQAADADVAKAAQPEYEIAYGLLVANPDPRYNSDAKVIYNYLGNYYLDQKDVAKAKEFFNKYLELDPDNAEYRKFVDNLK
ncbi:MAG: tetratricopeptide repeat protein [Muribaculaceae bacterium]|nr:tetratricopeptide repeat protein [Muribaculaceae bacterium]